MKRLQKKLAVVVTAFAAALALALPATALAVDAGQAKTGQFVTSKPQSVAYNGKAPHFRSTVKDENGNVLTEGKDFVRSFYFTDQRRYNPASDTPWVSSDDDMVSAGFVWENIHGINDYAGYGDNSVRHSIWTKYDLNIKNLTKVEGDPDPTLTATLDILNSNPNNKLNSSIFSLKRAAGEQPGDYAITAEANKEEIPASGTENAMKTRAGIGDFDYNGFHYYQVVGDDTAGFNQIRVVPGKLTIVPATLDVRVTIAWKDSSNKDGVRPSVESYAKLLSLTVDGAASDVAPVVVDNGDDTFTVTYKGVRKFAYNANGERHNVDYKLTQAGVNGYTTDNATVGNGGTITNTHAAKPATKPVAKPAAKAAARKSSIPKTGDEGTGALAAAVLGAGALGAAITLRKRVSQ